MQLDPLTGIIFRYADDCPRPSFFTFQVDDHAGGGTSKAFLFHCKPELKIVFYNSGRSI